VVTHAARVGRAEEPVEEHVLVGQIPVVRQVAVVVVGHGQAAVLALGADPLDEAVHPPAVVLDLERLFGVVEVEAAPVADVERPHARLRLAAADRHAGVRRKAVDAGPGAEVVVERVVLLHQEDEMLDRRGRRRRHRGDRLPREDHRRDGGQQDGHGRTS
jgi:hypothetical protein